MSRDLEFVLKLTEYISKKNRFPSSPHHLDVRKLIETTLGQLGDVQSQPFKASLRKPVLGYVKTLSDYHGIPYTNSPSFQGSGIVVNCGFGTSKELLGKDLKGKFALIREGKRPFREKEKLLKLKGARAVIVYRAEVNEIYNGISAGLLPVLSLKREDAQLLDGATVELTVQTQQVEVEGKNLWLDLGSKGHCLTFIAHYDTKPGTFGAIDNAVSVALLLWLASKLANSFKGKTYRIRFLFTDLEEYGLQGAEHFVATLSEREIKNTIAISVDTVGWNNPAVLYRDGEGFNDTRLIEAVERMLDYLKFRDIFLFKEGRSGRSDHIPFRRRGARTLFFASNPFPLRHTVLDNFSAVNPEMVKKWMQLLHLFATGFKRFLA